MKDQRLLRSLLIQNVLLANPDDFGLEYHSQTAAVDQGPDGYSNSESDVATAFDLSSSHSESQIDPALTDLAAGAAAALASGDVAGNAFASDAGRHCDEHPGMERKSPPSPLF